MLPTPARHPTEDELRRAYAGRRVLVTGHTGFAGSWLTLWLDALGADVTGYGLAPGPGPSLFAAAGVASTCRHVVADVRDLARLRAILAETRPDHVFHLAAQADVRRGLEQPLETLQTNVLGTANVLEALRLEARACAVVTVTSGTCPAPAVRPACRDDEALGEGDVCSASKDAAERVVSSYRRSFLPPERLAQHGVAVASARAGEVVGGGDLAGERVVPGFVADVAAGRPIALSSPAAVRPWQHVLEPLGGALLLGARLAGAGVDGTGGDGVDRRAACCGAWNLGPAREDVRSMREVARALVQYWGGGAWEERPAPADAPEAGRLTLAIDKARAQLGWEPRWRFEETFRRTVEWYRVFHRGAGAEALAGLCRRQVGEYLAR